MPTSGGRLVGNPVLELVDLLVEVVDQVEVALGHLIDEVVDVHADLLVLLAGALRLGGVERMLVRRRLDDGDEALVRRDEVDLLVVDPVLRGDRDREQEDPEDVVVVRFDPRARLVRVHVRREQRGECRLRESLREVADELLFVRVDELEPARVVAVHRRPRLASAPDVYEMLRRLRARLGRSAHLPCAEAR